MKQIKKFIPIIGIIIFIMVDQISKLFLATDMILIDGVLKLSDVQNTGGAFGIFNTSVWIFCIRRQTHVWYQPDDH